MIFKHLLEIKYRIFFSFIAWSFMLINCYYFKESLLYIFIQLSSKNGNDNIFHFLTTNITEVFMTYIYLSYFLTNQLIIIFFCYQIFIFISPGLYTFEYRYLKRILSIITFFWVIFIIVLNCYIFPTSWAFFLQFQNFLSYQYLTFYFEAKLSEYLIFYKSIYYLCSLIYQISILFFLFLELSKTNLLIIKKFRKIFYFLFFILATFLTPPEITYQLITSICILVIYELIIIFMVLKTEFSSFK